MNRFKSDRFSSRSVYRKLSLAIFAVLVVSNAVLLYLFIQERSNNKNLIKFVTEARRDLDQIHESLRQKDLQKAFRHLTEAQKQVVALLPAQSLSSQQPKAEKEASQPVPPVRERVASVPPQPVVSLVSAAHGVPGPLVFADAGEYLLVCEKDLKNLAVYRFTEGKFSLVTQYPCVVGANNYDKVQDGDFATPLGVYFFLRFSPGNTLPEIYGYGAYITNYPNFMDRREGKKGGGIWLHGHSPGKNIGFDVVDTKGCIVVSNNALREMSTFLNPRGTPIVIVNNLQFAKQEDQSELSKELRAFLDSWKHSWESIDTKKYLSYYSTNFVNSEGMSFPDFKKHKERTNRTKKFIQLKIDNLAILIPPEHGGKIAIARFLQRYNSNNFKSDTRKIFYLRKGQTEWQIIGESSY
ncbi:MAG: hypothetical protein FJ139_01770 [Deltaproteobacteria bacterium]|nr:hypothetical protein [Deltaproteobacteria bacterium]